MASDNGFTPALRLHPLSWLFALTSSLGALIIPVIVLLVFGMREDDPGRGQLIVAPLIIVALLVRSILYQRTYRYGFGPGGLVIREGLFVRNVRQIEYSRIENVDIERTLLHRIFGVAQARVQTSTGGKPEALINVLGEEAVREIRERIFSQAKSAEVAPAATTNEEVLLHLPPGELVRYGITDNRGLVLVAAGVGLLQQFGLLELPPGVVGHWLESGPLPGIAAPGWMIQLALGAVTILSALVALRVLSVVVALVTMHDFKLTRQEGDLRVRHGLLTKVVVTLRTRRIQAVHQTETLLHRLVRRVSVDVDLAGDSSGGGGQNPDTTRIRWLAPVCKPSLAPDLMATALPAVDFGAVREWQPLAAGARRRIFMRVAFVSALPLLIPAIWYLREGAVIVLGVVPLAWMHAHLYVRHTRWALAEDALLFRAGWFKRRLTVVPRDRVQSLHIGTTPFDRRNGMASVSVDTAGGTPARASVRIRYLSADVAERLAARLYRTADAAG